MAGRNISSIEDFFSSYPTFLYKKRETILFTHDKPPGIFFIKKGFVRTYVLTKDGKELTIALLKEKDIFPLQWAINSRLTSHYYESLTATEVKRAPKKDFIVFFSSHSDITYAFLANLLDRFYEMEKRLEAAIMGTAEGKIMAMLLSLATSSGEYKGKSVKILIPSTHYFLSTLLGLSRETVSTELKKLVKKGFLKQEKRQLRIPNFRKIRKKLQM